MRINVTMKGIDLDYGDVVVVGNRAYIVSVAPGFGGKSSGKAMLVNLETGDTRGYAPRSGIGPIDLNSIDYSGLANYLESDDCDIVAGDDVYVVI